MRGIVGPSTQWDQGDIVEGAYFGALDTRLPAVLLTPACDIDHGKADAWTLVALFPDLEVARALCESDLKDWDRTALSKNQTKTLSNTLRGLITQRFPRYQWMPLHLAGSDGYVADFTMVQALPAEEVKTLKRVGTVESRWKEQMAYRYSSYSGRVGTDDHDEADIALHVERLLGSILI